MNKAILRIENLTKYYGNILGVKNLNLSLNSGEIFGFIGPNGAGKSTTIRAIMNSINKTSGRCFINGVEFNKKSIYLKEKIGYLPGEINLYDDLTVKEMLDYHEKFYKKNIHKKRKELVERFDLNENKKIISLSLGNKKKLGIVLTFMHDPEILILDEPTNGLDPIVQNEFYELLREEKAKGKLIFYSSHILSEVSKVCDRVGIIKNGELIKIFDIKNINKEMIPIIIIKSKDNEKIIKDLNLKEYELDNSELKFKYNNANKLINILSKYKLDSIFINEVSLEDIFLNYYKEDKENA